MKRLFLVLVALGSIALAVSCKEDDPTDCEIDTSLEGGWELMFCDGFDSDELDTSIWRAADQVRHGSDEVYYSPRKENVYLEDGKLVLRSIETPDEDKVNSGYMPFTSARLETKGNLDFTYGRIVVRAKTAPGAGTWPAIWMLPSDNLYGNWPRSGEIDIMEYYGKRPGRVSSAYHVEKYNHTNTSISTIARTITLADAETSFNTYELIWTSESLTWRINGQNVHFYRYNNRLEATNDGYHEAWPFDADFHLIINLGMGDAGGSGGGEIDVEALPTTFEIDYVKIYRIDYDTYDKEAPSDPEYVELSNINDRYILWPRSEDDYGVSHYEIMVDGVVVATSPVNSHLFEDTSFHQASEVAVRAVDFTGKTSGFVLMEP
jgi:beta-glucanase (GH16 family)